MQSLEKEDLYTILTHIRNILIKDLEGNIAFNDSSEESKNALLFLNDDLNSQIIRATETSYTLRHYEYDYIIERKKIRLSGKEYILEQLIESKKIELKAKEAAELTKRANTDQLTGLKNRHKFFEDLDLMKTAGEPFSIIYCDLDNLRFINQEFGHNAGDKALQTIGKILRKNFRRTDIVTRFGGDEFVIAIQTVNKPKIIAIINNIQTDLAMEEIHTEKGLVPVSMSFGFSHYDFDKGDVENLDLADKALYYGKEHDKGRIVFNNGTEIYFINEYTLKKVDFTV